MSWKMHVSTEFLVLKVDVPYVFKKVYCHRIQVNIASGNREKDVKLLFHQKGRWHFETGSPIQRHDTVTLSGPESHSFRAFKRLAVEVHTDAETVDFLRRCALRRGSHYIATDQQHPQTIDHRFP
jgi:hypothetical protein